MHNKIINYFKQYIKHPSSLYKRIKDAPKQYIQYCQSILNQYPQWEKISYIIISLCNNVQLKKCLSCNNYLTYHQMSCGYLYCSDKCSKSNINTIQKRKQTNFKKYGNLNGVNQQKLKDNLIKKTGYLNPSQYPSVKIKRKRKAFERFNLWNKFVIPMFTFQEYISNKPTAVFQWKCIKCGNIFKTHIHVTKHISSNKDVSKVPRCLKCYPFIENIGKSKKEKQLVEFCKQYFPNLEENNRSIIFPKQLDIVIEELKLAIQFNGNYFHNINNIQLNYHLNKTEMCQAKGYRLIHIWQDQWNNNREEIQNKLIDIFKNKEVIDLSKPLDRCWYSTLQFQQYEILPPEIIIKNNYQIENCGYLKIII